MDGMETKTRGRKVALQKDPREKFDPHCWYWSHSLPFVMSTMRGVLVHRPRMAGSIVRDGRRSHDWVRYWCGNGTTNPAWLPEAPEGRVVCAACEAKATAKGQPTTDTIAGRHVHKGVLMARKTCCDDLN